MKYVYYRRLHKTNKEEEVSIDIIIEDFKETNYDRRTLKRKLRAGDEIETVGAKYWAEEK
jgi:hypothetical protein